MSLSIGKDLAAEREQYKDLADHNAGQMRLAYITDVPGQVGAYQQKLIEAQRYDPAEYAAADLAAEFPRIWYSAAARGRTFAAEVADILAVAAQWDLIDAVIDALRLGAKTRIDAASNIAAMRAAAEAVNADTLARQLPR